MSQIETSLLHLFNKHRIVFWYDNKRELRNEFEALLLPGIETIELANNEFTVKYRILREHPERKFLLYHEGPPPADLDHWLLDVQLAQGEFRADQAALWLSELGLGFEFIEVVEPHIEFFTAAERRMALRGLLRPDDTRDAVRLKMLAVCCIAEPRLDEILESLLAELAEKTDDKISLVQRSELDTFLWQRLGRTFGYQSQSPGIQDFAIELFKSCYILGFDQPAMLTNDAMVFLKRWKDSLSHHLAYEKLSAEYAVLLNIEQDLEKQDIRKLADLDLFRLIDQKILSDLARQLLERTITPAECSALIRQRRRTHWFAAFEHIYETLDRSAQFLQALDNANLAVSSLHEGVQRYIQTWHNLDHLYRKVIFHNRKAGQPQVLQPVVEQLENLYTNNYLLKVNNNWQQVVDASEQWEAPPFASQREFFERWVAPVVNKDKKIYVIISDALRYEVADELLSRVRREDRYEGELEPILSMLPSYTQLGMAALLPNQQIAFAEDDSGLVLVDGLSTQGTPNRDKILKQTVAKSLALRADEFLAQSRDTSRDMVRDHDVIYLYHNRIDAMGDKKESEERVFEAVEDTLDELVLIIKKLAAANATNVLVTADHGFIYQNRPIEESDFSGSEVNGQVVLFRDRRFALGKGLENQPGLKKFTAAQVGLVGEVEIQLPKSIHRLRLKGSGSRYVHGGASLQEVVVPVLKINKKRESDITQVPVDILRGAASLITSGQFTVTFYQVEPVSDKVQPRKLRAGIYTLGGELISDQHDLVFDLEDENPRTREIPVRFLFTRAANQANNQEVILRLEELISTTSHYQEYKTARYTLRRAFTSDFDF